MGLKWSKITNNTWIRFLFCVIPYYPLRYKYYRFFVKDNTFKFQGHNYKYFNHSYNTTWNNERAVEIPIICKFISENNGNNILEIGNVLSHYFIIDHDILDKYEKAEGVINEDVVNFQTSKKYKLIVSISTLEHVGWDENPRDPEKIFEAFENLKKSLFNGGKLVVTLPIGQNPILDRYIETAQIRFNENYYLKRISQTNNWTEIKSGFYNAKYNSPFPMANIVFIGVYQKSG
ncbi:hypothetical protein [Methanobacterium sp. SMA-27]|uniref:hypothetical protein n=1 Tax=Methanobacterium sp. SMA-27 TaxID=1495336 RepID=UPI00064E2445|nr:hypothetical protein [Methanobacterium sp. SMA-27]